MKSKCYDFKGLSDGKTNSNNKVNGTSHSGRKNAVKDNDTVVTFDFLIERTHQNQNLGQRSQ